MQKRRRTIQVTGVVPHRPQNQSARQAANNTGGILLPRGCSRPDCRHACRGHANVTWRGQACTAPARLPGGRSTSRRAPGTQQRGPARQIRYRAIPDCPQPRFQALPQGDCGYLTSQNRFLGRCPPNQESYSPQRHQPRSWECYMAKVSFVFSTINLRYQILSPGLLLATIARPLKPRYPSQRTLRFLRAP